MLKNIVISKLTDETIYTEFFTAPTTTPGRKNTGESSEALTSCFACK